MRTDEGDYVEPLGGTLFTGQWADLPLEELCKKANEFGYDGLELACWGNHLEVDKALSLPTVTARKNAICLIGTN